LEPLRRIGAGIAKGGVHIGTFLIKGHRQLLKRRTGKVLGISLSRFMPWKRVNKKEKNAKPIGRRKKEKNCVEGTGLTVLKPEFKKPVASASGYNARSPKIS